MVGRDEEENKRIEELKTEKDVLIELKDISGPMTLVRGRSEEAIEKAKELTKYYSLKARDKKQVEFEIC